MNGIESELLWTVRLRGERRAGANNLKPSILSSQNKYCDNTSSIEIHIKIYIISETTTRGERDSHALQIAEPPASCRISRPIYPPTKSQQSSAGSQRPTANCGRGQYSSATARAQRDAIPQPVLPHFICDAEATMDQGTKRKADDGGSGSSDKRSKVSVFLKCLLSLYKGEISSHERML